MERSKTIIRTSIIAIAVNLVLVLFKMAVGLMSNSIAVILDAVNNLGDALSSIITIIGTKLAGKAPDKKHPYGYGRIEYLASVMIAVIVLMAGIASVRESAEKIFAPEQAKYSALSLAIIAAAVIVKVLCGRYVKAVGKKIHAKTLEASGADSVFDALLSLATLAAAAASMIWQVSLEGILGLVISVIIVKAGIEMLLDTLNSIIGARADRELSAALKSTVNSFEEVRGAYDLALHNYGPMELIGSIHIEVDDHMTAREIHRLSRQITEEVYRAFGIILTVGIYASNTADADVLAMRRRLEEIVGCHPEVLQMHGFYADSGEKSAMFDIVVDFSADALGVQEKILAEIAAAYPDYHFTAVLDSDYSD